VEFVGLRFDGVAVQPGQEDGRGVR
jgi:hypothetical protein